MISTSIADTNSDKNSVISHTTSQLKLIKRTSRSKSLKIKRSDSQSLLEQSIPTYFVKKVPKFNSKNNEEQFQTADVTPIKIIKRKTDHELITQKKRQPTPVKSYKEMMQTSKTHKKLNVPQLNIQKQMQIHDLEKKLQQQTKIRINFQQKAKQFQNQVSIQVKKVKSLQKQLQIRKQKQQKLILKINELQRNLDTKNNDLKTTKSNFQKFQLHINQVKNQQYESEIRKIKQESYQYKVQNQQQLHQINSLKNQNASLKMEINRIKALSDQSRLKVQQQCKTSLLIKQIDNLKSKLHTNSSQKQRFLEQKVLQLQRQIQSLKQISHSKQLQIDYLNRKKHQQIQILRKRNRQQVKSLRVKFSALMEEYKVLKKRRPQNNSRQSKENINKSPGKRSMQKRQNRFACVTKDRCQQEYLCFSLSPDVK